MHHRIKVLIAVVSGVISVNIAVRLALLLVRYDPLKELKSRPYSTIYYDSQGKLLQVTSLENGGRREKLDSRAITKDIKKIFVKTEDKRFYLHNGVDYPALVSAFFQNAGGKQIVRGGSTITMQLVKMVNEDKALTVHRKLHDIFYANVIEAKHTKKTIFETYLNSLYFGHGATGLASAARTFYGRTAQTLLPQELCCLAVIPRNPTFYDPIKNKANCAERACELYNKIFHKKLTPQEFEQFLPKEVYSYPYEAPHYIRYLRQGAGFDDSQAYNPDSNSVTLSINLELELYAQQLLNDALLQALGSRISNASLLLIENKTGLPLAWVGSADFFDDAHNGQIDGVLVNNQPGSSMKPFLYALALETKDSDGRPLYTPSSILADIPQEFGEEKLYIPSNFNNRYNGPVRFRIALASSLNVPAVSILSQLGVNNYLEKLYELGFESLRRTGKNADLGLALGAGEVSLKELVPSFAVFARDGKDFAGTQIYEPDTARLICSILSDKAARALGFGYSQTFETSYPAIFKTGTSNQYQNIIALGATKDYTIGVWMGNFSGQTVIGKTGSSLPAWAAKKMLDYIYGLENPSPEKMKEMEFPEPQNWTKQKICPLSGMRACADCPATVYEYCLNDFLDEMETCSWHKEKDGNLETLYPPEYQQWARTTKPDVQINYNTAPLSIQTPKNNALFYYSQLHKEKQAVSVEVFGGAENTLEVYYDNKLYQIAERPFVFSLPVEKGEHSCTVICGQEQQTIQFVVK